MVKNTFKPEFINRIDEIIVFNSLSSSAYIKIANKFIRELNDRLSDQELHLEVSEKALDKIIAEGVDEMYGARPLKRYIQKNVETILARKILSSNLIEGSKLFLDVVDDNFTIKDVTVH